MRAAVALLIACAAAPGPARAQDAPRELRILPVDEAAKDATWVAFRNRLIESLDKRDRNFLLSIVDRDVRNGFGGERGVAEFRKQWHVDAQDSPLWRELRTALFLGSAQYKPEKGPVEFCAPYVPLKWPETADVRGGAIIAREALVKKEPSAESETVAKLSYDIVDVLDWEVNDRAPGSQQKWVRVHAGAGPGFVPDEQVRSPLQPMACFTKTPSGWRMTGFAPGGGD